MTNPGFIYGTGDGFQTRMRLLQLNIPMSERLLEEIRCRDFEALRLLDNNDYEKLKWLEEFKDHIESFDYQSYKDLGVVAVENLERLEKLRSLVIWNAKAPQLDFGKFSSLDNVTLNWHKNYARSLGNAKHLRSIYIKGFSDFGFSQVTWIRSCEEVKLYRSGVRDWSGLIDGNNLMRLSIDGASKLTDIEWLRGRNHLRSLAILNAKNFLDASAVTSLHRLQKLHLGDLSSKVVPFRDSGWLRSFSDIEFLGSMVPFETIDWSDLLVHANLGRCSVQELRPNEDHEQTIHSLAKQNGHSITHFTRRVFGKRVQYVFYTDKYQKNT